MMYEDKVIARAEAKRESGDIDGSIADLEKHLGMKIAAKKYLEAITTLEQLTIGYQVKAEIESDENALKRLFETCQQALRLIDRPEMRKEEDARAKTPIFNFRLGIAYFMSNSYKEAYRLIQKAARASAPRSAQRATFQSRLAAVRPYAANSESLEDFSKAIRTPDTPVPAKETWRIFNQKIGLQMDMALAQAGFGNMKSALSILEVAAEMAEKLEKVHGKPIRRRQVQARTEFIKRYHSAHR